MIRRIVGVELVGAIVPGGLLRGAIVIWLGTAVAAALLCHRKLLSGKWAGNVGTASAVDKAPTQKDEEWLAGGRWGHMSYLGRGGRFGGLLVAAGQTWAPRRGTTATAHTLPRHCQHRDDGYRPRPGGTIQSTAGPRLGLQNHRSCAHRDHKGKEGEEGRQHTGRRQKRQ